MRWVQRVLGGKSWASKVLTQHFLLQDTIEAQYKLRDAEAGARAAAVEACWRQIGLAPDAAVAFRVVYPERPLPTHAGFRRLRRLREAEGDLAGAIRLAREAQQQGWAGDWDAAAARCEKKLHHPAP